jgi:hypothetical protein
MIMEELLLALVKVLGFYFLLSAVVEASLKGLERLGKGTWKAFYKGTEPNKDWNKIWSPTVKWLMVILSIAIVWKVKIYFIHTLGVAFTHEDFSIGFLDPILTGLLISRGSNVIHDFIEKLRSKSRQFQMQGE